MTAIDILPRQKTTYDLPAKDLARKAIKLHILGSLTWDYVDTVCDIAVQQRRTETKRLCRAVRELRADYDRFRSRSLEARDIEREAELGLLFESVCDKHLKTLHYGLRLEIAALGLADADMTMVEAVQQAMTLLDAMKLYAGRCDRWIAEHGVDGSSILMVHFTKLCGLLPLFAGDCYSRESKTRQLTAKILFNELKQLEMYDDNGKI